MSEIRNRKLEDELRSLAGRFLMLNANTSSLLTVTHVAVTKDAKMATIYFTVFPVSFEETALLFAKRKRSEFKQFIRDNSRIPRIPHIDFEIDLGEKNRQRIDELSNRS